MQMGITGAQIAKRWHPYMAKFKPKLPKQDSLFINLSQVTGQLGKTPNTNLEKILY